MSARLKEAVATHRLQFDAGQQEAAARLDSLSNSLRHRSPTFLQSVRSRLPWQGPSMFHDDHHVHFHCNFGQCFVLWDRLHGTLRRAGRRYGVDVFGGKGAPAVGGAGEGHEFVRY